MFSNLTTSVEVNSGLHLRDTVTSPRSKKRNLPQEVVVQVRKAVLPLKSEALNQFCALLPTLSVRLFDLIIKYEVFNQSFFLQGGTRFVNCAVWNAFCGRKWLAPVHEHTRQVFIMICLVISLFSL
jgi:hypothetical protein